MRLIALCVVMAGAMGFAQDLSPPPLPPDVTPDSVLPQAEPRGFTSAFSSRISFFSTNTKHQYEVSLGNHRERCKAPCSLDTNAGYSEISIVRNGQRVAEEQLLPPGHSSLMIKSYSVPLITTGAALMSLSASALIAMAVLIGLFPYGIVTFLLIVGAPAALIGGVGVVLTAVGSHRPTMHFVPAAPMYSGM